MRAITIVIPVYNAFEVALECIKSVLSTAPKWVQVCVIDDASPDGVLSEFLPADVMRHPRLSVLRNEVNLGFVGTCNRGMLFESSGDVVLLNSDTIVTPRWIQKMRRAAYSRPKIGTVTPLTNNGTICSVPLFLENNSIPSGYSLRELAELVEAVSENEYIELPTCVGFCVYIRREMLDQVGLFDPIFKQGYGEENDLSLRGLQAGFVNIIDDATFIYHRGNMSFKEMRESLSAANSEVLRRRYVDYEPSVARFCATNPLARVHDRIWNVLVPRWIDSRGRVVLHVVHNGPFVGRRHGLGGTESHVQALIKGDRESAHFSLTPGDGCLYLTAHTDSGDRTLVVPPILLSSILKREFFDIIHVHHTLGFDLEELTEALICHDNYLVSIHDYHMICNRLWLFKPDNTACDGSSCGELCGERAGAVAHHRTVAKKLLGAARRTVVFSESSRRLITQLMGELSRVEVHRHGIDASVRRGTVCVPSQPTAEGALRVVCVGTFTPHKGAELILKAIMEIERIGGTRVEWFFLGRGADCIHGLTNVGEFSPINLADRLNEIGAHVALLAPQCHETYSLTLDELVWNGIPVIVSPFGALPERVIAWGIGYVFDNSIEDLRRVFGEILNRWEQHIDLFKRTATADIRDLEQEVFGYCSMYSGLVKPGRSVCGRALTSYLQPDLFGLDKFNPGRIFSRAKRGVSSCLRRIIVEGEATASSC